MRRYGLMLAALALAPAGLAAQADSAGTDSTARERPRISSRTVLPATTFRTFFSDAPEQLFGLVPGVVLRGTETGLASAASLSIRGGVPGGASVYIDGAPVRFLIPGTAGIGLGAASLSAVAVTTGVPDLSLPDVRDGVIEYTTRSGGERLAGSLAAATDEGFEGVGYNRFAGGVGGSLPLPGATWFVGGTLMGQRSHYVGLGTEDVPSYVPGGIDTTVVVGGQNVILPRFVDRRAYDWGTELRGHAKVDVTYGTGSRVSLTGVANETQERFFPGMFAAAPTLYTGARATGRLLVANWYQRLGSFRGGPLAVRINASLGSNQSAAGLLDPATERATLDPALGITLETLRFVGTDSIPTPVTDQLVRNIRTSFGLRVPFLNHDELRNVQESRANPYGMESSWPQAGLSGTLTALWEKRTDLRGALEWDAGKGHRVSVGADFSQADVSHYRSGVLSQSFMNAYRSDPGRAGLHVSEQFTRGTLRFEAALRYDHVGSAGLFARVPGRIYSHPAFNRPEAIASDTGYVNSLARVMTPGRSRDAIGGRLAVEEAVGDRATVRASFGRWVEPPPLGLVLLNSNSDLDFTSTTSLFGRDVDYGYASLAEFGTRYAVTDRLDADVAVYRRSGPQYLSRTTSYDDPANPGDVININTLTNAGDVVNFGADLALDWSPGPWIEARAAYGLRFTDLNLPGFLDVPVYSTHTLTGALVARPPGALLAGMEASVLLKLTSGTWYPSAFANQFSGTGVVTPAVDVVFPGINDRLPWVKRLDVRLRRAFTVGPSEWSFFAEARNLFGWQNFLALFLETGGVVNTPFRNQLLDVEFQNLETEAAANGALAPNGDILLPADCSTWTFAFGSQGEALNCVALKRIEARFGDGDGVYSLAERTTALHAFFNQFFGPQTFYGAGRSVRLGVEIRW